MWKDPHSLPHFVACIAIYNNLQIFVTNITTEIEYEYGWMRVMFLAQLLYNFNNFFFKIN
jgi:hypothetical protein